MAASGYRSALWRLFGAAQWDCQRPLRRVEVVLKDSVGGFVETLAWVEACVGGAENMERVRTPRRPNYDLWRFPRGPGKVWKILGGFEAPGSPETGKTPKTSILNNPAPL